jgi:hypothetical protein
MKNRENFFLASFVYNTLSNIYEEKYLKKNQSYDF